MAVSLRTATAIARTELRARRLSTAGWVLVALAASGSVIAIYPIFAQSEALSSLLESLPSGLMMLFGIDPTTFSTGAGFLQAQLYAFVGPAIVLTHAIGAGARATAGEEELGTADLLLAQPVRRGAVVLQKFVALATTTGCVAGAFAIALWLGTQATDLQLTPSGIIGANLGLWLLGLVHAALAMLVGAHTGRNDLAVAITAVFALGGFLLHGLGPLLPDLASIARVTPFSAYQTGLPLLNGPTAGCVQLALAAGALVGLAALALRGRDLGTTPATLALLSRQLQRAASVRQRTRRPRLTPLFGSVYGKCLWDRRVTLFVWMFVLCGLTAATMGLWPSIAENSSSFEQVIGLVPPEVFSAFGVHDPALLVTAEGFLSARIFAALGLVLVLIFAIGAGSGAVAGDRERGTLELELSTPVPRHRLLLQKLLALATLLAILTTALALTLLLGEGWLDLGLRAGPIVAASAALAAAGLFFGALALFVGAWTGRSALARGVPFVVIIAGFLVNSLSATVERMAVLRWTSPLYWYLGEGPLLSRGPSLGLVPLLVGTLALAGASVVAFERLDLSR